MSEGPEGPRMRPEPLRRAAAGSRTPRVPRGPVRTPSDLESRDPQGRMALFSSLEPEPRPPAGQFVVIECSSCLKETPVTPFQLARAALPFALFLPVIRPYPAYIRCPACLRRTWVRLSVRI